MAELSPRLGSRQLFPRLRPFSYLGHAGVSPLSEPVERAVGECLREFSAEGFGAVSGVLAMRLRLRTQLGKLLECRPEDLVITSGTSWGVLAVAQNFPWRTGDRIACVEGDFPTNVTPWQAAALQHGLELVLLRADLSDLETQLRKGLRLLALSAVSFQTGVGQPWEEAVELAHRYQCRVFVDAIQAAGVVPLAVGKVDYLAGGAHKWLMGVEGCGYLYVSPECQVDLQRHWAGWLSHENAVSFLFEGAGHLRYDRPLRKGPQFLEVGSSAAIAQVALEASLNILLELGVDQIFGHVQDYLDQLEPQLAFLGWESMRQPAARSGSLCFRPGPGADLAAWGAGLDALGVRLSTPDGHVRLAPHWCNSCQEIPRVVEAFREVQRSLR